MPPSQPLGEFQGRADSFSLSVVEEQPVPYNASAARRRNKSDHGLLGKERKLIA
jgi:hypothetical protein